MFHFLDKSDFLVVNISRLLQSQNRNSFLKPLLVVICASFLCTMRALFNRIPVSGFLCTLIPLQQWDPFSLHSSLLHSVSLPGWLFCRNVQENLSGLPCFIPVGQCHLLQAQIQNCLLNRCCHQHKMWPIKKCKHAVAMREL